LAIVRKNFRAGVVCNYDNSDIYESKAEEFGHINPSLEFYLFNNAESFSNALVVGAGFGLSTKQLEDAGCTVTSVEPISSRFALLEGNVEGTCINKVCGSSSGTATIYYNESNKSGGLIGTEFGDSSEEVDMITVDSLDLTLDLMLVYANGKEFDVLDGAVDTIANNPNMKIIIKWIPDLFDDVDVAHQKLLDLNKTVKIIHWEQDDSITFKTMFDGTYPDDSLKGVGVADLLLE